MTPMVTVSSTDEPTPQLLEGGSSGGASANSAQYLGVHQRREAEELKRWSETAQGEDSRVRYQRNERNQGLGGNENARVHTSRGEWVNWLGRHSS